MKKITLVAGLALILLYRQFQWRSRHPTGATGAPRQASARRSAARPTPPARRSGPSSVTSEPGQTDAADEAQEEQSAHTNASRECRTERGTTDETRQAFNEKYGTNGNKKNAFGKCVSQKAKAKEKAADAEDQQEATEFKNAAKECDAERGDTDETRLAFNEKYGTNANKKNAFGKCVSQKAREQHDEGETETPPAS